MVIIRSIPTEADTQYCAHQLAPLINAGAFIYLSGDLGAGKTTFVRGVLQSLGYQGKVKSPSYTLIESYQLENLPIYHLDLYRLKKAEEIFALGLEEYFESANLCFVEWPEKAGDFLPVADIFCEFILAPERQIKFSAPSERGKKILTAYNQKGIDSRR